MSRTYNTAPYYVKKFRAKKLPYDKRFNKRVAIYSNPELVAINKQLHNGGGRSYFAASKAGAKAGYKRIHAKKDRAITRALIAHDNMDAYTPARKRILWDLW